MVCAFWRSMLAQFTPLKKEKNGWNKGRKDGSKGRLRKEMKEGKEGRKGKERKEGKEGRKKR